MKFHYTALALASSLSMTLAQADGLPSCATSCATSSMPEDCNSLDIECICTKGSFITNISCCVATKCSQEDQDTTLDFAREICGGAGVTDLPKSASCGGDSSATSSASTPTKTGAGDASATDANTSPSPTEGGDEAGSSATPTETPEGAASIVRGKEIGLVAAIAAAVAFLV